MITNGGIISQLMARITSGGFTPIKIAWIVILVLFAYLLVEVWTEEDD